MLQSNRILLNSKNQFLVKLMGIGTPEEEEFLNITRMNQRPMIRFLTFKMKAFQIMHFLDPRDKRYPPFYSQRNNQIPKIFAKSRADYQASNKGRTYNLKPSRKRVLEI
jgi:hypothetical protein